MRSTRSVQSTKVGVVFLALTAMMLGLMVPASAGDHLVRICHNTASESNPYTNPNVPKHKIEDKDGHGSFEAGVHPGDIIPPFAAGSLGGNSWGAYPGKNWDEQGQAIWNNGCELPGEDDDVVITIAKDWTGASYDASDVVVALTVEVDGHEYINSPVAPGYKLTVDAGAKVEITAESVTGFDDNNEVCGYSSTLPGALTDIQDDATLTVTNDVTCDAPEATPTLTVEKVWTGDDEGNAEATFEVVFRVPFEEGTAGNDRIVADAAAESGDEFAIPADARGIELTESVTGLPAGCESALVATVDDQGFGSSDTDGLGDYGVSLLKWDDESILVTFTNNVECESTPTPTPTPTPTTPTPTPTPTTPEPEEPEVMDAVIAPTASISGECPEVGVVIEGSYELDNSASNMDVTYDVAIGDAEQVLIVEGGETYDGTFTLTPGDGEVEVVISVRDTDLVFSGTFDARDCVDEPDVAVEGVVEQRPATPVAAAPAALPETGVSALLLTLMGLLSLGFGGALLRPRKRD